MYLRVSLAGVPGVDVPEKSRDGDVPDTESFPQQFKGDSWLFIRGRTKKQPRSSLRCSVPMLVLKLKPKAQARGQSHGQAQAPCSLTIRCSLPRHHLPGCQMPNASHMHPFAIFNSPSFVANNRPQATIVSKLQRAQL